MRARLFGFPNPVNETSARLVATGVVLQSIAYLATRQWWLLIPLAYGFVARVLSGPRFSPLGRIVTEVITPRLRIEHRFVPGPPKRFAQGIGAAFSGGALLATALGAPTVALILIAGLTVAASLEAFFALCLGCTMFSALMRIGLVPERVCVECSDVSRRLAAATS